VHTGEEHETTLQQVRAKLYTMDSRDTYKEKGTGMLKVNVRKSDRKGARLGG
jgi:Ran-binding protein 3